MVLAFGAFADHAVAFFRAGPAEELRLLVFESNGVQEKFFQFGTPAVWKIIGGFEGFETWKGDGDDDEAVITFAACGFSFLFELDHTEGAAFDDDAGISGDVTEDHGVEGVAIGGGGARNEAPIVRINQSFD